MRPPVNADELEDLVSVLSKPDPRVPSNWSRRFKNHQEKLKSGDVYQVAEVVRNLAARNRDAVAVGGRAHDVRAGPHQPDLRDRAGAEGAARRRPRPTSTRRSPRACSSRRRKRSRRRPEPLAAEVVVRACPTGARDRDELEAPDPRRRDRHRADGVPRPAGPAGRQAHDGTVLPRARRRRRHRELRLPDRLRHGQQPGARVPVRQLRRRATATCSPAPTGTPCASSPWVDEDGDDHVRSASTSTTGELIEVAPRTVLRRQVEAAAATGLPADGGQRDRVLPVPGHLRRGARTRATATCGRTRRGSRTTTSCRRRRTSTSSAQIRRGLEAAGVPVEFCKGEAGTGQHEINLDYTTAVEMADRNSVYKTAAKEIAALERPLGQLHGEVRLQRHRFVVPHPLAACGSLDGETAMFDDHHGAARHERDCSSTTSPA